MRITLIIPGLTSGGAERVLVLLAQGFLQRGHNVAVITLSGKDTDFYSLPPEIERIALDVQQTSKTVFHGLWNTIHRFIYLRRAVREVQTDIVISFMGSMNIFTSLALLQTKYPKIGTEHISPKICPCEQPWEMLRNFAYLNLTKLVSVSQDVNKEIDCLPAAKKTVIYNPFIPIPYLVENLQLPSGVNPDKKWIVSMGRLNVQKGFDILLNAFQKIAVQYPDWQLLILGEGELKQDLENLRDKLRLSEQVVFTGAINPPFSILKNSDLFVMPSRFEGFPMAHGEALVCGLPVIATDCHGVRELIRDEIDGILVPNEDVTALADAMSRLMSDETERNRLAKKAPEVLERFSLDKVLDQWEYLIDKVLKEEYSWSTAKYSS
ncbi:glycosyltransferase family 4 protein [Calothrix sp. UHCC 0171]|uniref:glycosyltransferase family 4 protein n=1 Tax=Calothrix sp. UHCC 0171 TaxID=3110245 RepID=UPI002B20F3A6|nr:glycosyltransferase family 4 protein [Calothrix sp. UHCC 0171]MEA5571825.1 glycosyltransferase family 4 protein [Calothrix sp. UHCC 0171]